LGIVKKTFLKIFLLLILVKWLALIVTSFRYQSSLPFADHIKPMALV